MLITVCFSAHFKNNIPYYKNVHLLTQIKAPRHGPNIFNIKLFLNLISKQTFENILMPTGLCA